MTRRFRPAIVAMAALALLMLSVSAFGAIAKGKPAPNFTLKGLDGKTYQLSSFKGKEAVVLDFWATWCPPCQRSLPALQSTWRKYQNQSVQFIGVNVDGRGDVRGMVKDKGLTYPVAIDSAGVTRAYDVRYLPTLVVIDKQGIVREVMIGEVQDLSRRLSTMLDRYSK